MKRSLKPLNSRRPWLCQDLQACGCTVILEDGCIYTFVKLQVGKDTSSWICTKFCSKFYCLKTWNSISKGEKKRQSESSSPRPPDVNQLVSQGPQPGLSGGHPGALPEEASRGITLACRSVCRARERNFPDFTDHCLPPWAHYRHLTFTTSSPRLPLLSLPI